MKVNKIFQIGFNKCGTKSLYRFFKRNKIKSIHCNSKEGNLAYNMFENFINDKKLLDGYKNYKFFSDMIYARENILLEGYKEFKLLDKQYPNSLFILNLRNKKKWLLSRAYHNNFIDRMRKYYQYNSNKEVILHWSNDWDKHINLVREYFKNKNNLIEFNIEKDNIKKIYKVLRKNGFHINYKKLDHLK